MTKTQPNFWLLVARTILRKNRNISMSEFKVHFKLSVPLVEYVWQLYHKYFPFCKAKHLLWSLHFLKTTDTNVIEIANFLGTNSQTLMLHVNNTLQRLLEILPKVLE
jgi:hypothetical protein